MKKILKLNKLPDKRRYADSVPVVKRSRRPLRSRPKRLAPARLGIKRRHTLFLLQKRRLQRKALEIFLRERFKKAVLAQVAQTKSQSGSSATTSVPEKADGKLKKR